MRAVVFDRVGEPRDVLQLRETERPTPRRGEVLVRMIASPVNPSDILYIRGRYGLQPTLPATPGFEGVGIVEANGGGLLGMFRKGKRVAVLNDSRGNWSEYTVASARQVIPVPSQFTDAQAATFFVNPATAIALTQDVLKIPPGAWLLQTAANGALGKMIVRLGRKSGFRTFNIVRRPEQIDELKALGADAVVLATDDLPSRVREFTGGSGVLYAIDPVGGPLATTVAKCLGNGGRIICYGSLSGEPMMVDPRSLITNNSKVEGFWLKNWAKKQPIRRMLKLIGQVKTLVREGVLATEAVEEFPLDRFRDAIVHATTAGKTTKAILRIGS
jgi:NADPH:quinone reductase